MPPKPTPQSPPRPNIFRRSVILSYFVELGFYDEKLDGLIYWEPDQSILGLTVFRGMDHMYEKTLTKQERKELLLNPADTILEAKWSVAMKEEDFSVGTVTDVVAELTHSDQIIKLPRISDADEIAKRQEKLFSLYQRELQEISTLANQVAGTSPQKNAGHRPVSQSTQLLSQRRRPGSNIAGPSTKTPKQEAESDEEYDN